MARPLKFQSVEEFNNAVQSYFDSFLKDGKNAMRHMTVSGLAFHLDVDTQTLFNYEKKDEFFAPIKRAKQLIEMQYEERLFSANTSGPIFALKNFKWKDTQDLNLGGQPDNPIKYDDSQRKARIAELLIKCGADGAIGASGSGEDTADKE